MSGPKSAGGAGPASLHGAGDPEWADRARDHARQLPSRVSVLATALAAARADGSFEALVEPRTLAHRLHRASRSYGFETIGAVACRVEEELIAAIDRALPLDARGWRNLGLELDALRALARASAPPPPTSATPSPTLPPPAPSTLGASLGAQASRHEPRLLVVDADIACAKWIGEIAKESGALAVLASTPSDAAMMAQQHPPDAALLALDPGDPASLALAYDLRDVPGNDLPLAFVSPKIDVEAQIAAAHAGASLFLTKPLAESSLRDALRALLARAASRRARVMVVDDDPKFSALVERVLSSAGLATTSITDPRRTLEMLARVRPELLMVDSAMPGLSGIDVCHLVRTTPEWQDLPIVFVTADTDPALRLAAFRAGADDCLLKPVVAAELLARVKLRVERAALQRERLSTDLLTGLWLRRPFLEAAASRVSEANRHGRPFSVSMLDLDRFKAVNDRYGHAAGDQVLSALGRLVSQRFRKEDLRVRWGGEEVVIAFPGLATPVCRGAVERLRREFSTLRFEGKDGESFGATFSAGLAGAPDDGTTIEALLDVADRRLYEAKNAGRDRVVGDDAA